MPSSDVTVCGRSPSCTQITVVPTGMVISPPTKALSTIIATFSFDGSGVSVGFGSGVSVGGTGVGSMSQWVEPELTPVSRSVEPGLVLLVLHSRTSKVRARQR